jgi:uncharacterized glyoxalase superfamily protein PhnB
MTEQTNSESNATLLAAHPQLFVADISASCAYYKQTLGFDIVFTYGEPPFYAQVTRGGARLNFRCVDAPVFVSGIREREQLLSAYVPVRNVEALYREYQAAGADFHQPLEHKPWGTLEFVLRDPDGNLICCGSG